jgi:hypothetical protein
VNPRERFINTLKFQHPDRIYYAFSPARKATLQAWTLQGLPEIDDYDFSLCRDWVGFENLCCLFYLERAE